MSLENVIVKDEDSLVVGTIKVKNVGFEKEVVVRVTFDDWQSQQDIFCNFSRVSWICYYFPYLGRVWYLES